LVEVLAFPKTLFVRDDELSPADIKGNRIGRIGLQLDGMRACPRSGSDDCQRALQRLIMVARHLGDDERRNADPDRALRNLERDLRIRCHDLISMTSSRLRSKNPAE